MVGNIGNARLLHASCTASAPGMACPCPVGTARSERNRARLHQWLAQAGRGEVGEAERHSGRAQRALTHRVHRGGARGATAWQCRPQHGGGKWLKVARHCAIGRRGPEGTQRGAMKIKPGPNYTAHYSVVGLIESCLNGV